MPDAPKGSSYVPAVRPVDASVSGPVPVTPTRSPPLSDARRNWTGGEPAVWAAIAAVDCAAADATSASAVTIANRVLTSPSSYAWLGKTNAIESGFVSRLARADLFWSTERVAAALPDQNVRIVDCRFSFDEDMRVQYLAGHLPGAVYVSWPDDLSAPPPPSGHPRWMLQG